MRPRAKRGAFVVSRAELPFVRSRDEEKGTMKPKQRVKKGETERVQNDKKGENKNYSSDRHVPCSNKKRYLYLPWSYIYTLNQTINATFVRVCRRPKNDACVHQRRFARAIWFLFIARPLSFGTLVIYKWFMRWCGVVIISQYAADAPKIASVHKAADRSIGAEGKNNKQIEDLNEWIHSCENRTAERKTSGL
jgi:hypothetical protein